jgi:anti-sigma B factor antagonist
VTALATITDEHHGDVPVVTIAGEIDASNSSEVAGRLHAALNNRSTAMVVDLGPTTYIDSAGINVLFELNNDLGERQQQLHLVVDGTSPIARMLGIVGLDRAVPTHPTRTAALSAID